MWRTDAIVIGAGQAGLAMSHALGELGVEHVVLERGDVAGRWRGHWDSLRLLTPNWQTRLPGFAYRGGEPDGYMRATELADHLQAYARSFVAPVRTHTRVLSLEQGIFGYRVLTDQGSFEAQAVVIATGFCDVPLRPALGAGLASRVLQLTSAGYRNPGQLPRGGVLVVGASATGVQWAREIQTSGRRVTLAVGRHTRVPRRYRGRDMLWWLDRMGVLDERIEQVASAARAREQPSFQLLGDVAGGSVDLGALQTQGVRLLGRLAAVRGERALFADDLAVTSAASDAKLQRLLDRVDAFAISTGEGRGEASPARPQPLLLNKPATRLNLRGEGIESVLWATGFARDYNWLKLPVLDARGELRHQGGVLEVPGLYAMGLRFMRRRKSSFIDGVGDDARELAAHLHARLGRARRAA